VRLFKIGINALPENFPAVAAGKMSGIRPGQPLHGPRESSRPSFVSNASRPMIRHALRLNQNLHHRLHFKVAAELAADRYRAAL